MSTVFGVFSQIDNSKISNSLEKMKTRLNHWNADNENIWISKNIGFGHLMLQTTPESLNEILPKYYTHLKTSITADVRLDNRNEICQALKIKNTSDYVDSELIVLLYNQFKEKCVDHLIGDFAFVIWDEECQTLFCARDHIGIRPLFYSYENQTFIFSSEIKGILADDKFENNINYDYLKKVCGYLSPDYNETVYDKIFKVAPGESITIKNNQLTKKTYWRLDTVKETHLSSPSEYLSKIKELMEEAVKCRLRTSFQVGTELSGGLDSSTITNIVAKQLHEKGRKIYCFADVVPKEARPNNMLCDEDFVDEVTEFSKIDQIFKMPSNYNTVSYRPGKFLSDLDLNLEIADGPNNSFASFSNQRKLSASQKDVKILFSGFPGDNLVTSQEKKIHLEYLKKNQLKDFYISGKKINSKPQLLKCLLSKIALKYRIFPLRKKQLYNSRRSFLTKDAFDSISGKIKKEDNFQSFKEILRIKIERSHVSTRFENEIHNGKKYKVEPVFPLADIRLLEFMISIPPEIVSLYGSNRAMFRIALKTEIPEKLYKYQSKANGPKIEYLFPNWLLRQKESLAWLNPKHSKSIIPDFIDSTKFLEIYNLKPEAINSSSNFHHIFSGVGIRVPTENIIRWLEKNQKTNH
jgi:asparagine synthase (glutamine-hydrolysing)